MINYIILCIIIVIFIFYLNSINESFSCPKCQKDLENYNYINVYILDTNKNYSAYINRDNVDNIIIKSFNNLRKDKPKYFLKNVETIDYETNLRNTYQYVETKKTTYIQDSHIDTYVKNDVDLFHHHLNNNNEDEMIYMLNKMIDKDKDNDQENVNNNFDIYNDINLFCIPYLDSKILQIYNKNNYIIGLYDKGTPNRTIPFLPSNLSYNWLSDYNIYTEGIKTINDKIDKLTYADKDTKSTYNTKNNIYMKIVNTIDKEETKANIKNLKNDLIKNDYELSQLYIIDHNKLNSVKNIKNTKLNFKTTITINADTQINTKIAIAVNADPTILFPINTHVYLGNGRYIGNVTSSSTDRGNTITISDGTQSYLSANDVLYNGNPLGNVFSSNTKTKQDKIEKEMDKTQEKINTLIGKNEKINKKIKACDENIEKIIRDLYPKIDPPFDKNYKLYLKQLYSELQDYYNRPSPNCKKIQQYEKQKLKLQTFINKHKKYYKNMDLIIDLHAKVSKKKSLKNIDYNKDINKCSNIPNNLKLICDNSKQYQYVNNIGKQDKIDLLNGEITNPTILSSSDKEDLKDDLNELTFTEAANICFDSIPSNTKPLLNINSVINKPPLNVNSNDYYLNKFSNSYI